MRRHQQTLKVSWSGTSSSKTRSKVWLSVRHFPFMVPGSEHHRNTGLCCRPGIVDAQLDNWQRWDEIPRGAQLGLLLGLKARGRVPVATLFGVDSWNDIAGV